MLLGRLCAFVGTFGIMAWTPSQEGKKNMHTLPFAIPVLWSDIISYPFAILGALLFGFALFRLADRCRCYGLPRNLLFGAGSGAVAYALVNGVIFLGRSYGMRSLFLVELVVGFETAVLVTIILRLVFRQRPPRTPPAVEGDAG